MAKNKIEVQGLVIHIDTIQEDDYISITDIAKQADSRAADIIKSYLKNQSNIQFLGTWEQFNNPEFKVEQMHHFTQRAGGNGFILSVKQWIKETNARGLVAKPGRGGGTYAHKDIAIHFAAWLNPTFYYYLIREFQRLKTEEAELKNLQWHVSKLTSIIDEARNLLDTMPGQNPNLNRLNNLLNKEEK